MSRFMYGKGSARRKTGGGIGAWTTSALVNRLTREHDEYLERLRGMGKVRTLADMSEDEIQAIERQYGARVVRPLRPSRVTATEDRP